MTKLLIFCVTNKQIDFLEKLNLKLVGVGKEKFPNNYIQPVKGKNIQKKEKNYSELTFHYWLWKNKLKKIPTNTWIGFCQKRRFWIKKKQKINNYKDLQRNLLTKVPNRWEKHESILCKPIRVDNPKKMKIFKRGWRNLINDPSVLTNQKKQTIKLHFDMHHGFGVLHKSIDQMNKEDRDDFRNFVDTRFSFNPHIMVISKKNILNNWFKDLFDWLFKCEKVFGLKNLKGYDQERLYAYLAERYLSFWFRKKTKYLEWPWTFYENK